MSIRLTGLFVQLLFYFNGYYSNTHIILALFLLKSDNHDMGINSIPKNNVYLARPLFSCVFKRGMLWNIFWSDIAHCI